LILSADELSHHNFFSYLAQRQWLLGRVRGGISRKKRK